MLRFKKQHSTSLLSEQKEQLINTEERTHEMVPQNRSKSSLTFANNENNVNSDYVINDDDESKKSKNHCNKLSWTWKCLCLSSTFTFCLIIIIFILVLLFYVAPRLAQTTLNDASMDIINGTIYNPTNTSITLNTTIMISNTGFLNAKIHSTKVILTNNNFIIGTMIIASLNTKGNTNTIVRLSSVLQVTNKTQFQKSCHGLLQNIDQIWHISADNAKLTVDTGFIGKIDYSVKLNKDLLLKGSNLYKTIASNLNVISDTNFTFIATTDLTFISSSIFTFNIPNSIFSIYYKDVYIGYAPISSLSMKPGLNKIYNQTLIIESYSSLNNRLLLVQFFTNYINGENQTVIMTGPTSSTVSGYTVESTVIDGVLNETLIFRQ